MSRMNLQELKRMPRMSVRILSGWNSPVSCNTPIRCVKAEIIYTTKDGSRRVFGSATAKNRGRAIDQAWESALQFMNDGEE